MVGVRLWYLCLYTVKSIVTFIKSISIVFTLLASAHNNSGDNRIDVDTGQQVTDTGSEYNLQRTYKRNDLYLLTNKAAKYKQDNFHLFI